MGGSIVSITNMIYADLPSRKGTRSGKQHLVLKAWPGAVPVSCAITVTKCSRDRAITTAHLTHEAYFRFKVTAPSLLGVPVRRSAALNVELEVM